VTITDSAAPGTCPPFDQNGDGQVTIEEVISAINAALSGCRTATTTPPL
jgi:hypothetical protein